MVTSIARQSVILKCKIKKSVLVGNYEFYYLSGLLKNIYGLEITEEMKPEEIFSVIEKVLPNLSPKDENEEYLLKMVKNYEVLPDYDEQMKELFLWGANEKDFWKITTSYSS